jgi:hypothetical protein
MALCLALSGQITIAMLDRLQHALDVDHAPNPIAGNVRAAHHHEHEQGDRTPHAHDHHHEDASGITDPYGHHHHDQDDYDTPLSHQHASSGVLAPWLTSAAFVITRSNATQTVYRHAPLPPAEVAERRRDRPPKAFLEELVRD